MAEPSIYTVGGTVQAGGGIYLPRQADEELLALCRDRTFAYILAPRQLGKSSLMVSAARRLSDEGIQSVIVDLTKLGVQVTAENWYLGFLIEIADQLMLDTDLVEWWQSFAHLGITQRLTRFFQEILLAQVASPVVIFVDEIDTTLNLDFTDDFYAGIRYLYNARAYVPEFHRLSFVLIGVATPSDLVRDPKRTPFNIGQQVDLNDFSFNEARPLADGLGLPNAESCQALEWILKWTGGHPYLTQRLCRIMAEQGRSRWSEVEVDRLVDRTFFGSMSKQDNNLQFVRDMLTKRAPDLFGVLTTYRRIHLGKDPVFDEDRSLVKSHLKLSGIVRCESARLCVRNLIYRKVFDDRWLKEHLPVPLKMLIAQTVVFTGLVVSILILVMRQLGVFQPLELLAFDSFLRQRPDEPVDQRVVIVGIDEDDIKLLGGFPIPNNELAKMLRILQNYKPRIIGLDLFKDPTINSERNELDRAFREIPDVIGTEVALNPEETLNVKPPPELAPDHLGFADVVVDSDGKLRRSLLASKTYTGELKYSLPLRLAQVYLRSKGIGFHHGTHSYDPIRFGSVELPRFLPNSGGYVRADANGNQTLLNFRSHPQPFRTVSLRDVFTGKVNPDWVRDRIVLVGMTASSIKDRYITSSVKCTLYTSTFKHEASSIEYQWIYGVEVHAHETSQIISRVLDRRPLLFTLPQWGDFLWVWSWSMIGGLLAWSSRQPLYLALAGGATLGGLYVICFIILLTTGGWVPLIPSALAIIVSENVVSSLRYVIETEKQ